MDISINCSINSNCIEPSGEEPIDVVGLQTAWFVSHIAVPTYTGDLIDVKRSSDSLIIPIGADVNGDLDEVALLNHTGAGDGIITKVYGQSINSIDWTQSDTAKQPKIVTAGVVEKENGKPCMVSDDTTGQQDFIQAAITNSSVASLFMVARTNRDRSCGFAVAGASTARYAGYIRNASTARPDANCGTPTYRVNGASTASTRQALYDTMKDNQVIFTVLNMNMSHSDWADIGTNVTNFDSFKPYNKIHGLLLYNSDKTSAPSPIETNLNNYFSIY